MIVLSVVIPIYNESSNLLILYERLKRILEDIKIQYELIFINDGSIDNSMELIIQLAKQDERVRYIDLSRNFGHQVAVSAGLQYAKGEKIVVIDADLQDPPELIVDLLNKSAEGFEVVFAKRIARKGETWLKKQTARLFYRTLKAITNIEIPLDTGDFRIMDRKVVEILNKMPEKHKFLRGQIAWVGFRQTFVTYERAERQSGTSGYTYRKMLRLALDGITAFSDLPLKIVTWFGFLVSFVAFIVILFAFYSRFITQDYEKGWTSIMVSVLFIGGIQMIAIGIIGEYLSRMNSDIRKRPLFIIKDTNLENLDENIDN